MKRLVLAVVLLILPFINALVASEQHGDKDILNSYLDHPKLSSRAASAVGTELSSSSTIESRSSKSGDICIEYCTSPDWVQEGLCFKNQCWPARDCQKTQGLITESGEILDFMANIKMPKGVFCGLWTTRDCKPQGSKTEYLAHGNVDEIVTKMKGPARSYRCYYEGQNKRAAEELEPEVVAKEADTGTTAVETKTIETDNSKRAQCINIWWSNSPDNVQEGINYYPCVVPELCYTIIQPLPGGMSSLHFFDKDYYCDIWAMPQCYDIGEEFHAKITRSNGDLTSLMKHGTNDGRAKSFACHANPNGRKRAVETHKNDIEKRDVSAVMASTEIQEVAKPRAKICIDCCNSPDNVQEGICYFNNCAKPGECMNVNQPLPGSMGSIHFGPDVNCDVYRAYDCERDGRNSHAQFRDGVSDLTGVLHGAAHSYKCERASSSKRTVETTTGEKAK